MLWYDCQGEATAAFTTGEQLGLEWCQSELTHGGGGGAAQLRILRQLRSVIHLAACALSTNSMIFESRVMPIAVMAAGSPRLRPKHVGCTACSLFIFPLGHFIFHPSSILIESSSGSTFGWTFSSSTIGGLLPKAISSI